MMAWRNRGERQNNRFDDTREKYYWASSGAKLREAAVLTVARLRFDAPYMGDTRSPLLTGPPYNQNNMPLKKLITKRALTVMASPWCEEGAF